MLVFGGGICFKLQQKQDTAIIQIHISTSFLIENSKESNP